METIDGRISVLKTYFGVFVTGWDFYYYSVQVLNFPDGGIIVLLHKYRGKEISSHGDR